MEKYEKLRILRSSSLESRPFAKADINVLLVWARQQMIKTIEQQQSS
jgi:hypothetical protein